MIVTSSETAKLLEIMLRGGWSWMDSQQEGYLQIGKDEFSWYLPKNVILSDLVTAIEHEAMNRGFKQAKARVGA